jgi:bifunctional enzyme CysN/CysC
VESDKQLGTKQTKSPNTIWNGWNISREVRKDRNEHKAAVLWLTGYSRAGKTTIARSLERKLFEAGCQVIHLDGDNLRHGLCRDLGFSAKDRSENIRRVGEVAKLFFASGKIVICAFISPFTEDRVFVRSLVPEKRFFEVYVKCDLEVCKKRDHKGLYKKALAGEIVEFTGISSPYEEPDCPEIKVETDMLGVEDCVSAIVKRLAAERIIEL